MNVPNLWQCHNCGRLLAGDVGQCNGRCQDSTGKSCDAKPCPSCGLVHYWSGSVEKTRGLRVGGWVLEAEGIGWRHPSHDGRFSTDAAVLVEIGLVKARPAGIPPRPLAAPDGLARYYVLDMSNEREFLALFPREDVQGDGSLRAPPRLPYRPAEPELLARMQGVPWHTPHRSIQLMRAPTEEIPVTVEPPRRVELDDDTRDALTRLVEASRRNLPTVEVDTTDLALVVEHLAEAAGLDTDEL